MIDDVLDFTGKSSLMGKPALNDIRAGVVTCPVLFAAEEHPELLPMISRKFRDPGDVERGIELVRASDAIARTRALAEAYTEKAIQSLEAFGPCESEHAAEARAALHQLCCRVVQREM